MQKYSKKSVRPLLQKKCLELFVSTHEALSPPGLCATQLATFLSNSTLTLIIQARSHLPKMLYSLMVYLERTRSPMTNLDRILKSRDITLLTDGSSFHLVKAMVFPVVMYRCESWTIKKTEHQRIDAFELHWRRLLRVCWTVRRSNKSTLKEINSEYSSEELMLKLKL